MVLGFTYFGGNTFKQREFSKSFASVEANQESCTRTVGVICDLYSFNQAGLLTSRNGDKHEFFKIKAYIGTIKPPDRANGNLIISLHLVDELNKIGF